MFGTGNTTNESVAHNINGAYSGRYVWVSTYNYSSPILFPQTGAAEIQVYEWITPHVHYTFDEVSGSIAHDSTESNDGFSDGAAWTTGKDGGGLSFDGIDDAVLIS